MKYLGFDIGGTKCSVSLGEEKDRSIVILTRKEIPTDLSVSPYEMLDRMCEIAKEINDGAQIAGISCGGPLDAKRGIILSPPNLTGWDEVEVVGYLENKLNIKAYLENDANACAVAEWKFGAGENCQNMIFLTFGTGLGAGLILDGKLYRGTNDMAGEAGHIRLADYGPVGYGKAGSFEGFCSGGGIAQLAAMHAKERFQLGLSVSYCTEDEISSITAKKVAECANANHSDALEVFDISGKILGKGLSVLIDLLNPEKIVIGSIFQRSEHLLRKSMEEVIKKECLHLSASRCAVIPAALKDNVGDYAALSIAAMHKGEL